MDTPTNKIVEMCDNRTATILGATLMATSIAGFVFGMVDGVILETLAGIVFLAGPFLIAPRRFENYLDRIKDILPLPGK